MMMVPTHNKLSIKFDEGEIKNLLITIDKNFSVVSKAHCYLFILYEKF